MEKHRIHPLTIINIKVYIEPWSIKTSFEPVSDQTLKKEEPVIFFKIKMDTEEGNININFC